MQDEEPLRPVTRRLVEQPVLDAFGLDELRAYADALRQEIARAEQFIARKQDHRGAADAVFGKR